MKIRIVVDSSANLKTEEGRSLYSVPLTIRADDREFVDDAALDIKEMTDYLAAYKGKSGSACPSTQDWLDAFGDAPYVIAISITSNLSGAYNSARVAKEQYEEDYPERKVCLIDSLSTGPEMKLLVEKIAELIEKGLSFDKICENVMEYKKDTHLVFLLKSLTNLANNGRVNPAVAKIAGVLNIHLISIASENGVIEQKERVRGEKKAIAAMKKIMDELKYAGGKVRIDHCFNLEGASRLKELILASFPNADVIIAETRGLCSFYAEKGGILAGFECR